MVANFTKHLSIGKHFFKFQNKTFYDNFFKRKWNGYDKAQIHKDPIYYQSPEPIIFKNGKFLLLETTEEVPTKSLEYILLASTIFTGYKLLSKIIQYKILGTIIWGGIFSLLLKGFRDLFNNRYFFIKDIYLLEDCKTLEIVTLFDTFRINIINVRRITENEIHLHASLVGEHSFIPIMFYNQTFAMRRCANITNNKIFSAVTNGQYIKLSEDKKIDDNYIDI